MKGLGGWGGIVEVEVKGMEEWGRGKGSSREIHGSQDM